MHVTLYIYAISESGNPLIQGRKYLEKLPFYIKLFINGTNIKEALDINQCCGNSGPMRVKYNLSKFVNNMGIFETGLQTHWFEISRYVRFSRT